MKVVVELELLGDRARSRQVLQVVVGRLSGGEQVLRQLAMGLPLTVRELLVVLMRAGGDGSMQVLDLVAGRWTGRRKVAVVPIVLELVAVEVVVARWVGHYGRWELVADHDTAALVAGQWVGSRQIVELVVEPWVEEEEFEHKKSDCLGAVDCGDSFW